MALERAQNRAHDALREIKITPGVIRNASGSAEISFGNTRVLCTASIEEEVPKHALERGMGWLTAEYSMLPASTGSRNRREASRGKQSGRTLEIQRLIGRSLRAVVDLQSLKGHTLWIDCDVLEADGGTRTAAITGSYCALVQALQKLKAKTSWPSLPLLGQVAAISVGIVGGDGLLDLDYSEDVHAEVDANMVMTDSGRFIEIQATAEGNPFTEEQFQRLKELSRKGIGELFGHQKRCLEEIKG